MRTAVACLVLAAAIATPGIVVAATSSETHTVASSSIQSNLTYIPLGKPINPLLRPVAKALKQEFAKHRVKLLIYPAGQNSAGAIAFGAGECPVSVVFGLGGHAGTLHGQGPCAEEVMFGGNFWFRYSPRSIGPTVVNALFSLR